MKVFRSLLTNIYVVLFLFMLTSFSLNASSASDSTFVLVIDAGHGGKDPGAIRFRTHEKDVVLKIALDLEKLLRPYHKSLKVIMTRMDDRFVQLNKRADIANNAHADLFVSLHANSCSSPSIYGVEVYTQGVAALDRENEVAKMENSVILMEDNYNQNYDDFDPFSPESYIMMTMVKDDNFNESIRFSKLLNDRFKKQGVSTRGVRQAGFLVLRKTKMPSVLVEIGYLSNKKECDRLKSWSGMRKRSETISKVILDYVRESGVELVKTKVAPRTLKVESSNKKEKSDTNEIGSHFAIQLAASSKDVGTDRFGTIKKSVYYKKQNGWFRYYYGKFNTFDEAKASLNMVKNQVKDAFIVAFDAQGKKVSLKQLLKK
ncbi:N-acetylmuramoyl-L-alanine amidase [Halosquirtibacter xylanolyticus]|uniref:N-acetylmuramoyl-L-alanine amidase family protein n=1 Tax=Halosquirtibacter xylanolyticus TaxID=3374599 RepID=UPI0037490B43|nr:N-acetylmuramoyl-L-alanine amidase [Prolixibacteraceae bacterium]